MGCDGQWSWLDWFSSQRGWVDGRSGVCVCVGGGGGGGGGVDWVGDMGFLVWCDETKRSQEAWQVSLLVKEVGVGCS